MPVSVKIGGAWKTATNVYNKVGGVWKTATDMPVKVGGVWKTGVLIQGAYESIATFTGNGSTTTASFTSIPSSYSSLQIRINSLPVSSSGTVRLRMRVNNDTGANYVRHILYGDGTSALASGATALDYAIDTAVTSPNTTSPLTAIVDMVDYTSTSKNKAIKYFSGMDRNGSGTVELGSGLWLSTSAINRLDFYISTGTAFATGTSIALYGIKGA